MRRAHSVPSTVVATVPPPPPPPPPPGFLTKPGLLKSYRPPPPTSAISADARPAEVRKGSPPSPRLAGIRHHHHHRLLPDLNRVLRERQQERERVVVHVQAEIEPNTQRTGTSTFKKVSLRMYANCVKEKNAKLLVCCRLRLLAIGLIVPPVFSTDYIEFNRS